jgi:hypothetical protein
MSRLLAVAPVLVLIFEATAPARPQLDPAGLGKLDQWEVLTFADPWRGGLQRGKAIGVFSATPDEVFRVAADYAKYQDYLPRVRSSTVSWQGGGEALVEMTADLPWPAGRSRVQARYVQQQLPGDIYRIEFAMVSGQMKHYLGSIYIEPWADGRTAVTYELVAEPDILAPRSAINRSIVKSAGGFVHALRQRVSDLHKLGYLHPQSAPRLNERAPLGGAPARQQAIEAERNRR